MRANQLNGVIYDLGDYMSYINPLEHIKEHSKLEVNLLTGEIFYMEKDDLYKFYKEKARWFVERIKKLNGKMSDFEEAKIVVDNFVEAITFKYKGKIIKGGKSY